MASLPYLNPVPRQIPYTGVLRTESFNPIVAIVGVLIGLGTYFTAAPMVLQLLTGACWVMDGQPGTYLEAQQAMTSYHHPCGVAATGLAIAILLPISWGLVRLLHRTPPRYLSSVRPGLRWRPLFGFFLTSAVVLNLVLLGQNWLVGRQVGTTPQQGFLWFMAAALLTTPLQAAAEEYFFRGYLMQSLGAWVASPWFGIVASALVFALLHGTQNVWLFLDRFAFGVLAGVLVVRSGGLEAAIAVHVANNLFAYLYAGLSTGIAALKAVQVIGPVQAASHLVMFGLYTAVALLLARRWNLATVTSG